jgi:cell division protein FtsI (penicillin-binding protein 3)
VKINGSRILIGLDIFETGEDRIYPYQDTFTPIIGYTKNKIINKRLRVIGLKGLEGYYNKELNNFYDGILKGERDIGSYIIFNKNSIIRTKQDGSNIKLNISLKLQKNIELMLDRMKQKLEADEIIAAVMESNTGKIIAFASSNRYNPNHIKQQNIKNGDLLVKAVEFPFEPGSVIKPIALSLALNHYKVTLDELFYAYNKGKANKKGEYPRGKIKVDRYTIKDDHRFKKHYITLEDIIVYSSNIGTLQIANRLSAKEFYEGYKKFGFGQKSGIDLTRELTGNIRKMYQLRAGENQGKLNIFKSTMSYGQGMSATFIQVLRAYSVFNNNGKIVIPKLANLTYTSTPKEVISQKSANIIKSMLKKVVQKGTGEKAQYPGLEIGGKTGTANIAKRGKYQRKYISSFFGFANDQNHKYTIGVSVFNPVSTGQHWYYYYASHSAVPTFRQIVDIMVKLNYLLPNPDSK